ncbi:MAG: dihydrolipoyl dehydrogenase, partial [Gammaproteobacteria bacterium]
MSRKVDVAIIGAGSAGLYALSQVRHAGRSFALIDGGELGTTCARVGCMPSKVLIQVAEDFHHRKLFEREGIDGAEELSVDGEAVMEYVQDLRDHFVDQVLTTSTDEMGDEFIAAHAHFTGTRTLQAGEETIEADAIVIATGSTPVVPRAWQAFGDRILTTDSLFELEDLPASMAVIGLGVIGMELGQALARLGVDLVGIDIGEALCHLSDREVNQALHDAVAREFPLWLGHGAEIEEGDNGLLRVRAGENVKEVEKVLVCMGRRPNLDSLNLEAAGITLNECGLPDFDPHTMRVQAAEGARIYIAGDVDGERPILHEAGDEGRIAGYNAARETDTAFGRKVPLSITFCDPNVVQVGKTRAELDAEGADYVIGAMKMAPLGRALILGRNRGLIHLYCDRQDGRLLGAALCAVRGENLGHLLAWSMEQGLGVFDMLHMPFYHPVVEEALQGALRDAARQIEQKPDRPWDLKP